MSLTALFETNNTAIFNHIYPRLFTKLTPANIRGTNNPYNPLYLSVQVSDKYFTMRHSMLPIPRVINKMDDDCVADDAKYWYCGSPSYLDRIKDELDDLELEYELTQIPEPIYTGVELHLSHMEDIEAAIEESEESYQ